ncbi:MAG TPA: DinB family protein [Bacteroidia bacterium]|nr:DinB family protein [Bacteroidia bacterium]
MKKSDIKQMPEYFDRYINLTDDVTYMEALQTSLKELEKAPLDKWKSLGDKTYAAGKWTVKDILQHYLDTERVFTYRIVAISRGDKQKMNPYDEEEFAKHAQANRRTLEDIYEELLLVRKATIAMFKSFTPDMMQQQGNGFNGMKYCVLSLGFMLAGHQRWHFRTLEDKYYGLLKN